MPKVQRPNAPQPGEDIVKGITQESEGPQVHLRGEASIETFDTLLEADEIDYNKDTGVLEARGHVHYHNYESDIDLKANRVDYNMKSEMGTFYEVTGSAPGKMDYRPGVLTTGNPFVFAGAFAERDKDHYILHNGWMTNCTLPNPAWRLEAPTFDIIPNDRAIAYRSIFKLQGIPLLYVPAFYKSMEEHPRRSGFLTPNFGNSSKRGFMFGAGYYWAINRSYDASYRVQLFTARGLAHTAEFRGKPTQRSDFGVFFYGVQDKGLEQPDGTRKKEGGYLVSVTGRADLGDGFYARGLVNYLSSFIFRQSFTESFNEAVFSEVNSVAYVAKDWDTYHFTTVFTRQQNYITADPESSIIIRKLPQVEFDSRDREIFKTVPLWISWSSEAGLNRRTQDLYQTRQFSPRLDAAPQLATALHWKDIHLIPSFTIRETYYGSTFQNGTVTGNDLLRSTQEFKVDLVLPSLERVFPAPHWLGDKVKHVIETRGTYRWVNGVKDFQDLIRFDATEILTNTSEAEVMVTNRLFAKRRDGRVDEVLSWEVAQSRFFDPTFGGALVPGQRNVIQSSADLTAYTFFDQYRNYSPIVSTLRATPRPGLGIDYRTDYDPLRSKFVNTSATVDGRVENYFLSLGYSHVACIPLVNSVLENGVEVTPCGLTQPPQGTLLTPFANQFRGMVGFGQENKRGWNGAFLAIYDLVTGTMQFANTQITYNTTCCAYSFQYRRFGFGTRNENQWRFALVIANIGSFGTLKRQERLF